MNATTKTRKHETRKHESTKNTAGDTLALRIETPLSEELEAVVHRTIGCCIEVHKALGPGLPERAYKRAICLELSAEGISFEAEKRYSVFYRDRLMCEKRVDLVVEAQLVLEIKSVEQLAPVHRAQLRSYLRISKLPVGMLMNFNVAVLPDGMKRMVL